MGLKMFVKIPNDFIDHSVDFFQFNSMEIRDKFESEHRKVYVLNLKNEQEFWKHCKNIFRIQPSLSFIVFTSPGLVSPHIDVGDASVSLNYYLQTDSRDSTIYYEKKHENVKPFPNTSSYSVNDLNEISSFRASKFDTFLLDVKKIHGIQKNSDQKRVLISFRWNLPLTFNQVYESLIL